MLALEAAKRVKKNNRVFIILIIKGEKAKGHSGEEGNEAAKRAKREMDKTK